MEGRVVLGASSNLQTQPNISPPSSMATSLCLIMPTFMDATCTRQRVRAGAGMRWRGTPLVSRSNCVLWYGPI